jgi:hypothetical protein
MIDKYFAGYCGSWTLALHGETYQKRISAPIAQLTVGTGNGARKGSGLG